MQSNGQESGKGGAKEEDKGTGTGKKVAENGLLATLSGKGWPKRPFSGASGATPIKCYYLLRVSSSFGTSSLFSNVERAPKCPLY